MIAYLRQSTTLHGIALLLLAAMGYYTKLFTAEQSLSFIVPALPLLGVSDTSTTILNQVLRNGAALGAPTTTTASNTPAK